MKDWVIIEKNNDKGVAIEPQIRDNVPVELIEDYIMMEVVIEGRVKNKVIVGYFINQLIKGLGLSRLRKPMIIVKFETNCEGGAMGLCDGVQGEYAEIRIARQCPLTGRKIGFIEMMQTLAHEMVHAKQFLRGELFNEGGWAWKGRKADGYEYENQPWEKEAYKLEGELFMEHFPHFAPFNN